MKLRYSGCQRVGLHSFHRFLSSLVILPHHFCQLVPVKGVSLTCISKDIEYGKSHTHTHTQSFVRNYSSSCAKKKKKKKQWSVCCCWLFPRVRGFWILGECLTIHSPPERFSFDQSDSQANGHLPQYFVSSLGVTLQLSHIYLKLFYSFNHANYQ